MLVVPAIAVGMPILPDEEITDSGMLRAMMNGSHKVLWYLGASIAFGRRLGEFLKGFFPEAQVSARAMCRVDW